jgi:DnaJ family protein C protein 2
VIASSNYFQAEGTSPSPSVIEKQLAELDVLVESLEKAGAGQGAKAELVNKAKTLPEGKFTEFA